MIDELANVNASGSPSGNIQLHEAALNECGAPLVRALSETDIASGDLAAGPRLLYLAKYFGIGVPNPWSLKMSFESNLARLEEIVAQLEGDRLDLNAALGLFEEGIELLRLASGELNETETRVKELIERADGVLELRDLGS